MYVFDRVPTMEKARPHRHRVMKPKRSLFSHPQPLGTRSTSISITIIVLWGCPRTDLKTAKAPAGSRDLHTRRMHDEAGTERDNPASGVRSRGVSRGECNLITGVTVVMSAFLIFCSTVLLHHSAAACSSLFPSSCICGQSEI